MTVFVGAVTREKVVAVSEKAGVAMIVDAMRRFRVRTVPVIDAAGRVVGIVTEDDLPPWDTAPPAEPGFPRWRRPAGGEQVANELMTSPAVAATRAMPVREAARLMHRHRLRQLPVVDADTGRLTGIVHQADLLDIVGRPAGDLAQQVQEEVIAGTFANGSHRVAVTVQRGVVTLSGHVPARSLIPRLVETVGRMDGVVDVETRLTYGV